MKLVDTLICPNAPNKIHTKLADLHGAMSIQNRVLWVITPRKLMLEEHAAFIFKPDDESNTFLKNASIHPWDYRM
jgi:hypothetical protein